VAEPAPTGMTLELVREVTDVELGDVAAAVVDVLA
jgi:hypothetical protein